MKKEPGEKKIQITIHLPIDKDLDLYLSELGNRQERSKIQQIRFILNEYMKKNPL